MRRALVPLATALLIAIGAVEASVSAQQLAEAAGRPRLESAGVALTAAGVLASALVYLALGYLCPSDRAAVRAGAVTGALAGLLGGAVRALIISDAVGGLVARYADVPSWFVPAALALFVVLSCGASVVAGGTLAWSGRRLS